MSAIYELKNQIYNEISDMVYNIFNDYKDTDFFNKKPDQIEKYAELKLPVELDLNVKAVKLGHNDVKSYFYDIGFELYLTIINNYYNSDEKYVYNITERVLKLLSTMEFYYCYKLNNHNIRSEIIIQTNKIKQYIIKVNWFTNLHMNNNLIN